MSAPAAPAAPAPRDACLLFRNGRLVGVETSAGCYTPTEIVAKGLLTMTDRMILGQLGDRVDKLLRQLDAS